ncbi:hypothetical protein ACKKBG_A18400 [Auxenochlorella protothecoides x Auxenochlorella symbiontica]
MVVASLGGSCRLARVGPVMAQTHPRPSTMGGGLRHSAVVRAAAGADAGNSATRKILFVCLGNICRSPTAEAVFRAEVERAGLSEHYFIDSCGTGGGSEDWYRKGGFNYNLGNPSDKRTARAAKRRGYYLTSISRPLAPEDLVDSALILVMERRNELAVLEAAEHWRSEGLLSVAALPRIENLPRYLRSARFGGLDTIPDPYFGGPDGFETVLDLVEEACVNLLTDLEAQRMGSESGAGEAQEQQA